MLPFQSISLKASLSCLFCQFQAMYILSVLYGSINQDGLIWKDHKGERERERERERDDLCVASLPEAVTSRVLFPLFLDASKVGK